jgi:hypothetical protein
MTQENFNPDDYYQTPSGIYIPKKKKVVAINSYLYKNIGPSKRSIYEAAFEYAKALKESNDFILDSLVSNQLTGYLNTIADSVFLSRTSLNAEKLFEKISTDNPEVCLTYSGRIKCLIEVLRKLNMLVFRTPELVKEQKGPDAIPDIEDYIDNISRFRDTIGIRYIFDGLPEEDLLKRISDVANWIIPFMIQLGYTPEPAHRLIELSDSPIAHRLTIDPEFQKYFKDYISYPKENGYQSLHIVFKEDASGRYVEVQFRTLSQHVEAEHGKAHHDNYKEKRYSQNVVVCPEIFLAIQRNNALKRLDLKKVRIRGFAVYSSEMATATKGKEVSKKRSSRKEEDQLQICDTVGLLVPRVLSTREKI